MKFLYTIFISLFMFGMKIFSLFNDKTKRGVQGRKKSLEEVKSALKKSDLVIWMHAASLGEYEQGLPVLEQLKQKLPNHKILVTFFSPSGYENVVKKKTIADVICYLPFDSRKKIKEFMAHFSTQLFFTVKYDYWYHLLEELNNQKVKTYVISALFYEKQAFFTSYGKWFAKQLQKNIDWFFHQTQMSYVLAKSIGLEQASVTGDTRFDRVKQLRERDNRVDFVQEFIGEDQVIVFGSSWQAEDKIAEEISEKNTSVKLILAPHDLKRVQNLKLMFPDAIIYSEISHSLLADSQSNVLIIDSIGLLSKLYSYADIAVVGGGFHEAGLHNILEAATFGVPVIFGNKYRKNPEADELISSEGGKSFDEESTAADFALFLLDDHETMRSMSENAKKFVDDKPDSTALIIEKILS